MFVTGRSLGGPLGGVAVRTLVTLDALLEDPNAVDTVDLNCDWDCGGTKVPFKEVEVADVCAVAVVVKLFATLRVDVEPVDSVGYDEPGDVRPGGFVSSEESDVGEVLRDGVWVAAAEADPDEVEEELTFVASP